MPVSTIQFQTLNADTLPAADTNFPGGFAYGTIVGGDTALQSKDAGSSYVRILPENDGSLSYAITVRPVATPPIPSTATASPLPTSSDQTNSHAQMRLETDYGSVTSPAPDFAGYSSTIPLTDFPGVVAFASPASASVGPTHSPWHTSWWDETNSGHSNGFQPLFLRPDYIVQTIVSGGYFILGGGNALAQDNAAVWISYLQLQVTWDTTVELRTPPNPEQFRTFSGTPFNLLIPGAGWVPWRDHGSSA